MEPHPPDVPDIDPVLLDRYLAGKASLAERAELDALIAAHPGVRDTVARLAAGISQVVKPPVYSQAELEARARALRGGAAVVRDRDRLPMPRRSSWRWVAGLVAAVLVIAVGDVTVRLSGWRASAQQFREFASAVGSRVTVSLRDGTRIVLGPATRIRVPADFGVAGRAVELDGEAVFTVVHDSRRPFAVRTARAVVRDVGTTFAVRAYGDERDERVAVAEGEVELGRASLRARDLATIDATGAVTVRRGVDVAGYLAFAQGRLVFDGTPLGDAMRELARTYNLDIRVADSTLARKVVTASFTDEPVDEVLNVITNIVGARYERMGRVVVIRGGSVPVNRMGHTDRAPQSMAAVDPHQ
jgi:transmembrane sensor